MSVAAKVDGAAPPPFFLCYVTGVDKDFEFHFKSFRKNEKKNSKKVVLHQMVEVFKKTPWFWAYYKIFSFVSVTLC